MSDYNCEYKTVNNMENSDLDYMLLIQMPDKYLRNLVKNSETLYKKLGFMGFRPAKIPKNRLYRGFASHLEGDFQLYKIIIETWYDNALESFEKYANYSKEDWIENIKDIIKEEGLSAVITYIRVMREDLHDIIAPLLKEYINLRGLESESDFDEVDNFSELYGVSPFEIEEEKDEDVEKNDSTKSELDLFEDMSLTEICKKINKLAEIAEEKAEDQDFFELYLESEKINEELKEDISKKEDTIKNFQRREDKLRKQLEKNQGEIDKLNKKTGEMGSTIGELRQENKNKEDQLKKAKKETNQIEKNIKNEYEKELKDKDKSIKKLNNEISNLKKELKNDKEKLEEQKTYLNKAVKDIKNKDEEIDNLIKGKSKLEEEISKLKEKLTQSSKQKIENKPDIDNDVDDVIDLGEFTIKANN